MRYIFSLAILAFFSQAAIISSATANDEAVFSEFFRLENGTWTGKGQIINFDVPDSVKPIEKEISIQANLHRYEPSWLNYDVKITDIDERAERSEQRIFGWAQGMLIYGANNPVRVEMVTPTELKFKEVYELQRPRRPMTISYYLKKFNSRHISFVRQTSMREKLIEQVSYEIKR